MNASTDLERPGKGHVEVGLCVLYGSRAQGNERPVSDLDLALWAAPLPTPATRLAWRRELRASHRSLRRFIGESRDGA